MLTSLNNNVNRAHLLIFAWKHLNLCKKISSHAKLPTITIYFVLTAILTTASIAILSDPNHEGISNAEIFIDLPSSIVPPTPIRDAAL